MNDGSLHIAIIGTGYVGLTTGVCLGYLGHKVKCVDKNSGIISELQKGKPTIHEPGLQYLMQAAGDNLEFSASLESAIPGADVVIIAVGTPSKQNGDANLSFVDEAAKEIGSLIESTDCPVIVNKSTVPIGSARRIKTVVQSCMASRDISCKILTASNPEFLREGSAINDMLYPDRLIVGADDIEAINVIRQIYRPILEQTFTPPTGTPRPLNYQLPSMVTTNPASAELTKYAANCFLATKISFINEFACLAEKVGADIKDVARGIGSDVRIGSRFLDAGLGWGGICFGKDTRAIAYMASQYGCEMDVVQASIKTNYRQRLSIVEKLQLVLKSMRGTTIGILGLAFKPNTDDLRDAPAIDIIEKLLELGARVKITDPFVLDKFRNQYPDLDVEYCNEVLGLSEGCDALVLVTEWREMLSIKWDLVGKSMQRKVLIDGRNMFNKADLEKAGFIYMGVGR
jgi:UDPglucose 6-dehydrogenase